MTLPPSPLWSHTLCDHFDQVFYESYGQLRYVWNYIMWSHNDENIMLYDYIPLLGLIYFMWSFFTKFYMCQGENNDNSSMHIWADHIRNIMWSHTNSHSIGMLSHNIIWSFMWSHNIVSCISELTISHSQILCNHIIIVRALVFDHIT